MLNRRKLLASLPAVPLVLVGLTQEVQQAQASDLELYNKGRELGLFNVNTIRERYGLPPVDGGDIYTVQTPTGAVPLDRFEDYFKPDTVDGTRRWLIERPHYWTDNGTRFGWTYKRSEFKDNIEYAHYTLTIGTTGQPIHISSMVLLPNPESSYSYLHRSLEDARLGAVKLYANTYVP